MGDIVEIVVVIRTITGGLEILSREVLQGLFVEHILKMLKLFSTSATNPPLPLFTTHRESKLKDGQVNVALSLGELIEVVRGSGQGWHGEQCASSNGRELHVGRC